MENKKKPFTIEDFEKGLMLAGLITPLSTKELQEREGLQQYEKELAKEKKNIYFKRAVLAAEIAYELHKEPTLGRVKFQKMVYLCENIAEMKLHDRYAKFAAGPFDNKFMHSIDKEFKTQKWFDVEKITENNITRQKYNPLENVNGYKKYYASYFSHSDEKIHFVIELFRRQKTDIAEIAATIFACLIELKTKEKVINKNTLLELFYDWSDKKKRFTEETVVQTWEWMIENGITPF